MAHAVRNQREESGPRRIVNVLLVMLALMVEGFDLQAANLAGPSIIADFGISRSELGPLLSASLVGVLLGSTMVAPLGDRFGRKRILVIASLAYGVLSLIAAKAWSIEQLAVLRFLIGIGLGAVMPNGLALAGEMFEEHRQAGMTALVGIGITMGGVVAGVTAAEILPTFGWSGLFVVGGLMPLAIGTIIAWALPTEPAVIRTKAIAGEPRPGSLSAILSPPMRAVTIVIWIIFAGVSLNFHLLSSWIPVLMKQTGLSMAGTAWTTAAFHAGGVIGGIVASLALTRGGWRTVAAFMAGAASMMAILAMTTTGAMGTVALIVMSGFFVTGTMNAINGAAGGIYPVKYRATGLGWALGIARLGSILGPLVGSLAALVGLDRDHRFFAIPVVPLLLVMLLALFLSRHPAARFSNKLEGSR